MEKDERLLLEDKLKDSKLQLIKLNVQPQHLSQDQIKEKEMILEKEIKNIEKELVQKFKVTYQNGRNELINIVNINQYIIEKLDSADIVYIDILNTQTNDYYHIRKNIK